MTSEENAEYRTIFVFVPPQGLPQDWSLALSRFSEALGTRHPGAVSHRWSEEEAVGESLSFTFTTASGACAEGTAAIVPNGVAIKECTVSEAVEFAEWLLDDIVPPTSRLHANIREGVELDLPPVDLPRGDVAGLRHVLTSRVTDILEFEAALHGRLSVL